MRARGYVFPRVSVVVAGLLFLSAISWGRPQGRDRITQAVDDRDVSRMRGNVHPAARAEFDRGPVAGNVELQRMQIFFQQTPAQQDALNTLLEQQQDPRSPNYHRWLTPEQYAERFSVSQNDFDKVRGWLEAHGFIVVEAARSRAWIAFSGTAAQVQSAFHTQIHEYDISGETHHANAEEPALPAAFAGVVLGVRGLNDFKPKPRATVRHIRPNFTSSISGNHFLAPDDFATIYDLKPLYSSGVDGTGVNIAVMGQTDVTMSDIDTFRAVSSLPKNDPRVVLVPGSADPGIVTGDIDEADLDLEWAGAVARNASLVYVNSKNGAFDSLQYAVDQNLAPVITISYGDCEANFSSVEVSALRSLAAHANSQGQTIFAASGDAGAADCDFSITGKPPVTSASHGLAVDLPAALPSVTGVGGGEFNEGSGTFWNTTNNTSNGSAISYIPEKAWNDTAASISSGGGLAAGGGGKSSIFGKPVWQIGPGVPSDGARDVPDISLNASPDHDGYLVCSQGSCVNGFRAANSTLTVVGGTSAGAPTMAGIIALINQKAGSQGNVNPKFYALAASSPEVFHDIITGNNKVPCASGTKDCPSGGSIGYSAGTGYDRASGLGSVDGFNLANAWSSAAGNTPDFQLVAANQSLTIKHGTSGTDTLTLTAVNGFSGAESLTCNISATLAGTTCTVNPASVTSSGKATLTVNAAAQIAGLRTPSSAPAWGFQSAFLMAAGLLFALKRPQAGGLRGFRWLLLSGLLLMLLLAAIGCGGAGASSNNLSNGNAVTPVSGTVTVTATSGTLTHSVVVAVTIN